MVIGGGPAGYVAAIRASQLGMITACVEARPALGGTCLNEGCIPSKALLDSSERYYEACHVLGDHGIRAAEVELNLGQMMQRKDKIVKQLTQGVKGLLRGNKVDVIHASARVGANRTVVCTDDSGNTTEYQPDAVIIASGSYPIEIPPAPVDDKFIFTSTGALEFSSVPKQLCIVGAGVIGLELGSVWARLGSEVVLLEALDDFLPMADREIARQAQRILTDQGLDIRLSCRVTETNIKNRRVQVTYQSQGEEKQLEVDALVVAVGRNPATENLLLEGSGIELDERGRVFADDYCQTTQSGVYAVGDVVRGPMLAHKGMEEGVMVVERIAGEQAEINYELIPSVIYTHPEIAWVGATEEQLKERNIPWKAGSFPFAASGRALASGEGQGMIKVLLSSEDGRLLGAHAIGPSAAELVQQADIAMEFGAIDEDLTPMIFAHPTVSEALHEAILSASGRAIHIGNTGRKRS